MHQSISPFPAPSKLLATWRSFLLIWITLAIFLVWDAAAAVTEFPSTGGISINDNSSASPYPSTIAVSGITGTVTAVRVKITGFTHSYPDDVDIFLVGPGGQVCSLFSDAGGGTAVTNLNFVFDPMASGVVPNGTEMFAGTYLPCNYEAGEVVPPGANGSIGTNLTALAAGGANGNWKLYVNDDDVDEAGSIASWSLEIETGGAVGPELVIERPAGAPLVGGGTVAFPVTAPGSTSVARVFTLQNNGTAALSITGVSLIGGNSAEFSLNVGGMLTTIPTGNQTTFSVTFSPTILGLRTTTLRVLSNDANEATTDLTLSGLGGTLTPELVLEDQNSAPLATGNIVTFAGQSLGGSGALMSFFIRNTGNANLTIGGISVIGGNVGDFTVNTPNMLTNIPGNGQTLFSVLFKPTALGNRTTTLRVLSNDADEATTDITLNGTGEPPGPVHELVSTFTIPARKPSYGTLVAGGDGYLWGTSEYGGTFDLGAIYKVKEDGSDWQTVLSFTVTSQFGNGPTNEGAWPQAGLVTDGTGFLWGTTGQTIFKVNVTTGLLTTVATMDFASVGGRPYAALTSDGQGNFWGATSVGGPNNFGTIFKVNVPTRIVTPVVAFTGQTGAKKGATAYGTLISDGAGNLWGTTSEGGAGNFGTIYKVNLAAETFSTVVEFTGNGAINRGKAPYGNLTSDGADNFWGTTSEGGTSGNGTIFKVNVISGTLTTVVDFTDQAAPSRGSRPLAGLVGDGAGNFWGTTYQGADSGSGGVEGTVFKVNASTGGVTSVAEFSFTDSPLKGFFPRAGLVSNGAGSFFGTTSSGGMAGAGTVFKINAATGVFTTLAEFGASSYKPDGKLVSDSAGNLWGVTTKGGKNIDNGTIFKVKPASGARSTVFEFDGGNNGGSPNGALVADGQGYLWGTTSLGGAFSNGTVFKVHELTGILTPIIAFTGNGAINKGYWPAAGLMNDGVGNLWGTTQGGGASGNGTIFKVNIATNILTTVAEFTKNGTATQPPYPKGELISDGAGNLWGTTEGDVNSNRDYGTVYKLNVNSGVLTTVVAFTGSSGAYPGANPACALTLDGAGNVWGTTQTYGGIFKVALSNGAYTPVANATVLGGLVNDGVGYLWGASAGTYGSVYKVSISTGAVSNVVGFTGIAGTAPGSTHRHGALLRHTDGNFYGVTSERGPGGGGTLFRVRFGPTPLTQAVSGISGTVATLNASINPNLGATTAEFEWGTSPTLATFSTLSAGSLPAGADAIPVSALLSGLTVGSTYYYRSKASNPYNATPQRGAIFSFSLIPKIAVEQPVDYALTDGTGQVDFGHMIVNIGTSRVFTIRNVGYAPLNSLVLSKDGANPGDFVLGTPGSTTLAPGASTTVSVTFRPLSAGTRTAVLHISSNVSGDENPFDLNLTGVGGAFQTESEKWRLQWFGTSSNIGNAADAATPKNDGIPNLLKFGTAMDPSKSGEMPGVVVRNGNNLEFTYTRSKAAQADGLAFQVEWKDDLNVYNWGTAGVVETILSQDATAQQVKATLPAGASGKRFVHLKVTR